MNLHLPSVATTNAADLELKAWQDNLSAAAQQLATQAIGLDQWQRAMEFHYALTPLTELLNWLDGQHLREELICRKTAAEGEATHVLFRTKLPAMINETSATGNCLFTCELTYLKQGYAIPPQVQSNMAAASLLISGSFHIRQYDKIEAFPEAFVLQPIFDEVQQADGSTSIINLGNRVQWIKAMTADCFFLTTKLLPIDAGQSAPQCDYLDIYAATDFDVNLICAPLITASQANQRYRKVA